MTWNHWHVQHTKRHLNPIEDWVFKFLELELKIMIDLMHLSLFILIPWLNVLFLLFNFLFRLFCIHLSMIVNVSDFCCTVACKMASSVNSVVSVKVFIFLSLWRNSNSSITRFSSSSLIVLEMASFIKPFTFLRVSSFALRKNPMGMK